MNWLSISKVLRYPGIAIAFFLSPLVLFSQTISGLVTDSTSHPLYAATVTLLDSHDMVINYSFTDQNGSFRLLNHENGYWIEARFIGYKSEKIKVENTETFYHFKLNDEPVQLKDIVVKKNPAPLMSGDTLSYDVSDFSSVGDRSIADVLRNLPGVDVAGDGSIYFNGEKIENLYIDGDDVMDGRYEMGTKVIKKELISRIEIIKHHQPIKVLKDKVFTNKIAINLTLQNENDFNLSGSSQLGIGLPKQLEASVAPVLLNGKIKVISLAAYNNAGIDYKNNLRQQGTVNFIDDISTPNKYVSLSLSGVSPPDIPLNYYYFNNSALGSLNTHYKTKNDLQFKLNSNFYSDKNHITYQSETIHYLANETIKYYDSQKISYQPMTANFGVNLMINKQNYFLNNSVKASLNRDYNLGYILFNDNQFTQSLNTENLYFSNDFNWIPSIKNRGVLELRWLSSYGKDVNQLNIGKDYFFEINPQTGYYDRIIQNIKSPTRFNNTFLSYKIPNQIVFQEYRLGFSSQQQRLASKLSLINNEILIPYYNDLGNDAIQTHHNGYLMAQYQIKFSKFRSDIQLPVSFQKLKISQPFYQEKDHSSGVFFQPKLGFTYNFNSEKYLRATYQLQDALGDINTAYSGAILLNYRRLQSYSQAYQHQKAQHASLMYSHQKSIKLFYLNLGVSYNHSVSNTILSDSISNNINQAVFLPYTNSRQSASIYGGVSQYFIQLKTKFGLKAQKQALFSQQFVNGNLLNFRIDNFSLNISADRNLSEKIFLNYNAGAIWSDMKFDRDINFDLPQTKLFVFDHQLSAGIQLFKSIYFETKATHKLNKWAGTYNPDYIFIDVSLKLRKIFKEIDFELNGYNLLNTKTYNIISTSASQLSSSAYDLRGFMLMLNAVMVF